MARLRKILSDVRRALMEGDASGIGRADNAGFDPLESDGVTVGCHVQWPTKAPLLRAWRQLLDRAPEATVFQSAGWQVAGWKATHPVARLRILTIHRGTELLGVVPLCLTEKRGLVSPSPAVSDYLEPLLAPEAQEACLRAALTFIASHWDATVAEVTFHNLREGASVLRIIPGAAADCGFTCEQEQVEVAPAISLPATWEEYLSTLDAHERKEIRRKLTRAEEKGSADLVVCEPAETREALHRVLGWMEAADGEKGQAVRDFVRPLMDSAGEALVREGWMEVLVLRVLGEPACGLLQFRAKQGPMLYNLGYDPQKKEWSPGIVATAMTIRRAISQGFGVYDLLRGGEEFKYRLGAKDRPLYRVTLKKKGR